MTDPALLRVEIAQFEQGIREYVNRPRKPNQLVKDGGRWNQLCSAMDALGDAEAGIDAFLDHTFKENDRGALYLAIYGVLQLMFVEQDAVRSLSSVLDRSPNLPHGVL